MDRDQVLKAMTLSLRVGELMLESSVAVSDVEDAMRRLADSLGLRRCEVSVTLNVITLNHLHPALDGPVTLVKVVDVGEPRLDRLAELEDLARRVEAHEVRIEEASRELDRLDESPPRYSRPVAFVAALVAAAAWVVFAGGGLVGAAAAVVAAVLVELVVVPLARTRVPAVFATFVATVVVVAVPHSFAWAGISIALTPAVAGSLYPLLPGGALVASVTDGLSGAPLSSLAKGLQATVVAVAIAAGALATLGVADRLEITSDAPPTPSPALAVGLAAGIAVAGLAVSRSMPLRFVAPAGVVGVVAWAVVWASAERLINPTLATFAAAVVIGAGGQLVARLLRTTATLFTSTAVYVLVPGITFYLAMVAFAQGDSVVATDLVLEAVRTAGAIAAGIALGVALGRSVPAPRPRMLLWRRSARRVGRPAA
jgi:uncharacterized membrane protein YjjP (DUF1212 family)